MKGNQRLISAFMILLGEHYAIVQYSRIFVIFIQYLHMQSCVFNQIGIIHMW